MAGFGCCDCGAVAVPVPGLPGPGVLPAVGQDVGDGTTGPFVIVHGLNTTDVNVVVRNIATGYVESIPWRVVDANTVSVEPGVVWAANSRRVLIQKIL